MQPTLSTPTDNQRRFDRFDLGSFVAPGMRSGTPEGFLAVNVSRGGMSLLRLAESGRRKGDLDLDGQFAWVGVPLPTQGRHVVALAEVMHRRMYGPLESVGVKFRYLSPDDQAALDRYLADRAIEEEDIDFLQHVD